MKHYKRWQGVRAAHVPLAKRDGIVATGPGYIEVVDPFGARIFGDGHDFVFDLKTPPTHSRDALLRVDGCAAYSPNERQDDWWGRFTIPYYDEREV